MVWKPNVTVAAVVEHNGRFLVVEERIRGRWVYNQPAGHLEPEEGLTEAVVREMREETGREFHPEAITGVYRWCKPDDGTTFLRFCFAGSCGAQDPVQPLDKEIRRALWMSREELAGQVQRLRSPMVLRCIDDCLGGARYPLALIRDVHDEAF